jgi:hypothetical protein
MGWDALKTRCPVCGDRFLVRELGVLGEEGRPHDDPRHELTHKRVAACWCRACDAVFVHKVSHDCFDPFDAWDYHGWHLLSAEDGDVLEKTLGRIREWLGGGEAAHDRAALAASAELLRIDEWRGGVLPYWAEPERYGDHTWRAKLVRTRDGALALVQEHDEEVGPLLDGDVLSRALEYAIEMHGDQVRKGSDIPYVAHVMAVAAMVLEDGGGAKDAAAALLHDVVEDTPATLDDVRVRFGGYVERIVRGCSDSLVHVGKQEWRARKEAYLERLPSEPPEVLRVSVADKLHNARSILSDLERDGVGTLDRFKGGRDGTLWYYRSVLETYRSVEGFSSRWLGELERVVGRMAEIVEG